MAFTETELQDGLWRSVGYFCVMLPALIGIIAVSRPESFTNGSDPARIFFGATLASIFLVLPAAGGIAAIVALGLGALVRRTAQALADVPRIHTHLLVYGSMGMAVGAIVLCGVSLIPWTMLVVSQLWPAIIFCSTVAPLLAWWRTKGSSLRAEHHPG